MPDGRSRGRNSKKSLRVASYGEELRRGGLHACILYPSLGSPAILSGDKTLTLLLLGPDKLTPADIAARLCFIQDANEFRSIKKTRDWGEARRAPLSVKPETCIRVAPISDNEAPELEAIGFKGVLHEDLFKSLKGKSPPKKRTCPPPADEEKDDDPHSLTSLEKKLKVLTQLYSVSVDLDKLDKPWSSELKKGQRFFLMWRGYLTGNRQELHEQWLHAMLRDTLDDDKEPLFIGKRLQSELIAHARLSGHYPGMPGLSVQGDFPQPDSESPITDYHPFYVLSGAKPLNCAFMSDLHLVTKFRYLKHSNLRVVPGIKDSGPLGINQVGPTDSPIIGEQLLDSVDTLASHFNAIQQNKNADVLMLGGDLVDFHEDHYPEDFEENFQIAQSGQGKQKPFEVIWDACGIEKDKPNHLRKRFQAGTGTLGLYRMVVNFVLSGEKPAVVLAGNHDAYQKPFGISPRIGNNASADNGETYIEVNKGNEGIPADCNLTILEACLAFGPSYSRYIPSKHNSGVSATNPTKALSNFTSRVMEMFYLLYTPFRTWTGPCGSKRLVVLDWGDEEVMFFNQQGSLGHLPTANKASSSLDLKILDYADKKSRTAEVIALSHFTFACFDPQIPFRQNPEPVAYDVVNGWNFDARSPKATLYNVGSSRVHRDEAYRFLLSKKVCVSLAGHAHRAGFYRMQRQGSTIQVKGYPFPRFSDMANDFYEGEPLIAVSDSAGPIPRENSGFLQGWGSQPSSWTLVTFDPRGRAMDLQSIPYAGRNSKPRLAVALDYVEIARINAFFWSKNAIRTQSGEIVQKIEHGKNEIMRAPIHVKAAGNATSRAAVATLDLLLSPFATNETAQKWRNGLAQTSTELVQVRDRRERQLEIERLIQDEPIYLSDIKIQTDSNGEFTVSAGPIQQETESGELIEAHRKTTEFDFLPNLLTTWVGEDVTALVIRRRTHWSVKFAFNRNAIRLPPNCSITQMSLYFRLKDQDLSHSPWYKIPLTPGEFSAIGNLQGAGEGGEKLLQEMQRNMPFKLNAFIALHLNGGDPYQKDDLWVVPALLYFLCTENNSRLIVIRHVFPAENPNFKERL